MSSHYFVALAHAASPLSALIRFDAQPLNGFLTLSVAVGTAVADRPLLRSVLQRRGSWGALSKPCCSGLRRRTR